MIAPNQPTDNDVAPAWGCPCCGERNADRLLWQEDGETVRCATCGTEYQPLENDDATTD